MKTKEKLKLPKKRYFLDLFSDAEDVQEEFGMTNEELKGVDIILAFYSYENYSGNAEVIFAKGNKLYTVHGSHCSCYGLEKQWDPVETSWDTLYHMYTKGSYGENYWEEDLFIKELKDIFTDLGYINNTNNKKMKTKKQQTTQERKEEILQQVRQVHRKAKYSEVPKTQNETIIEQQKRITELEQIVSNLTHRNSELNKEMTTYREHKIFKLLYWFYK